MCGGYKQGPGTGLSSATGKIKGQRIVQGDKTGKMWNQGPVIGRPGARGKIKTSFKRIQPGWHPTPTKLNGYLCCQSAKSRCNYLKQLYPDISSIQPPEYYYSIIGFPMVDT
jgi:hypothetical protein